MNFSEETKAAIEIAKIAGPALMQFFVRGHETNYKAKNDPVTDADIASEELILEELAKRFPKHSVLSEESSEEQSVSDSNELWVVDPVDGTVNFIHGIEHFTVSIAHYKNGSPHCGVVYNPATEQLFVAEKNKGAYKNNQKVRCSEQSSVTGALVATGFYYDRGEMMENTLESIKLLFRENIQGIRRMGTASLDLCMVGCGQYDAFFEYQLSPWDFAAGGLFLEEAGGKVSNAQGHELSLKPSSVLASNGILHQDIRDLLDKTNT